MSSLLQAFFNGGILTSFRVDYRKYSLLERVGVSCPTRSAVNVFLESVFFEHFYIHIDHTYVSVFHEHSFWHCLKLKIKEFLQICILQIFMSDDEFTENSLALN